MRHFSFFRSIFCALIGCFFWGVSFQAVALDTSVIENPYLFAAKSKSKQKKKKAKPSIDPESSESVRSGKTVGASLRMGYFLSEIFGTGVEGFVNTGPKFQLGFLAVVGVSDLKGGSDFKDNDFLELVKYEASGDFCALQGRYFFTDSFSLVGGIGYRKIKINIQMAAKETDDVFNQKVDISNITANVDIGNIWTWPNGFFVGADWVGLVIPLSKSYTVKTETTGQNATQEINDAIQKVGVENGESLGGRMLYQFLFATVGFSL